MIYDPGDILKVEYPIPLWDVQIGSADLKLIKFLDVDELCCVISGENMSIYVCAGGTVGYISGAGVKFIDKMVL